METPKRMPRLNLRPTRGDTFECQLKFKDSDGSPVDWQGYSARSQVRPSPESETVLVEFDVTLGDDGMLTLAADELNTNGWWDLEVTNPDGDVSTVMGGRVIVNADVTRSA